MGDVLSAEWFGFLLGQIEGRTPSPIDMANGSELIRSHETLRSLLAEKDAEIATLREQRDAAYAQCAEMCRDREALVERFGVQGFLDAKTCDYLAGIFDTFAGQGNNVIHTERVLAKLDRGEKL